MPYADPEKRNMSAKRRAEMKAARNQILGAGAPPKGWTATKIATNGDGDLVSVRSVPEPAEDEFLPVIPAEHYAKGVSTFLTNGEPTHQWVKTDRQRMVADAQRWAAIEALVRDGVGGRDAIPAPVKPGIEKYCNLIIFGDPHFGMLAQARETGGQNWDMKIAQRTMEKALCLLLARLPRASHCKLINIGDYFHFQDPSKLTPRGKHQLDGDCRFTYMAELGCFLMARLTEMCLAEYEEVEEFNVAGNHDPEGARWLNIFMRGYFRNEPRLKIADNAADHLYTSFGQNLIGLYHGHETPIQRLPGLMAAARRKDWGEKKHCRWVTGHHHSYESIPDKNNPGVILEKYPTLAPVDVHAANHGYLSERSLNAVILHHDHGEVGRVKVLAEEVD